MGLTGALSSRDLVAAVNRQRQGDHSDRKKQHRKSSVHNGLTCDGQLRQSNFYGDLISMYLWYWLINHSVFRHDIDRKPTEFLFDLCKQKNSPTCERKVTVDCAERDSQLVNQCLGLTQFTHPEALE